jgi:acetyl esterase/lipase
MRMLATAAGVLSGCVCLASAGAAVVTPDLPFGSPSAWQGQLRLDLVTPGSSPNPAPGVPTVILLYGGGYTGGNKIDVRPAATALADLGFNVVCPNYTLATSASPSFPKPVADVLNCVRWVRGPGAVRGLSPTVVVAGYSAGATIGVTAALASRQAMFYDQPPLCVQASAVDAVVGFFGRYDLVWNAQAYGSHPNVVAYLGTPMVSPAAADLYARASAITYAGGCAPPAALWHGDADTTVPVENTLHLAAALQNAGATVSLNIVPGGGHDVAMVGGYAGSAAVMAQAIPQLLAAGSGCPVTLPSWGACCVGTACSMSWGGQCAGDFTPQAFCSPMQCAPPPPPPPPQPTTGACCVGARCEVREGADCAGPGLGFGGPGSVCNPAAASRPCCYADFDRSGAVDILDVFAYLRAWFDGREAAATLEPSPTRPALPHLFRYLNLWFAGC